MGYYRLGMAFIAVLGFTIVCQPQPSAAAAASLAVRADALVKGAERIDRPVFHRHRTQSAYCYPKNLWWFYRPYTTGLDGHARCMPYFHYLGPGAGRGPRSSERYAK
jgi:hypothetical protein